jgi:hypothetical protein
MGVLKGYFDDSADSRASQACALAGYVGTIVSWQTFEPLWRAALDKHDVPYFHMKELGDPTSELGKKFGGKENERPRSAFFGDLIDAIRKSGLVAFGSVIRMGDLAAFNKEKSLKLRPMAFCLFSCLNDIYMTFPNDKIELELDGFDKARSQAREARRIAETHLHDDVSQNAKIGVLGGNGPFSSKDVLGLQAADFLTWEVLKYNCNRDIDIENVPVRRKSYELLCDACDITGAVWTYKLLNWLDGVRKGSWPSELKLAV